MLPLRLALTLLLFHSPIHCQTTYEEELRVANEASRTHSFEQAVTHYQKVITASSDQRLPRSVLVNARTGLATAYFMLHRYSDSLEILQPLIRSSGAPSQQVPSQAWLIQGLDYLDLNRLTDAINAFRHALASDPNSANARLALGDALARSERLEEAAKEYEEQTRRTPMLADAWYKLGLAHSALANEVLGEAEKKSRKSAVTAQLLAEERLNKGNNLAAAKMLFRLVHEAPRQPGVHADLGHALLELGYPQAAEGQLRAEFELDPDSPLAMVDLAQVAVLRRDWEKVSAELSRARELYPSGLRRIFEFPAAGLVRQAWVEKKLELPRWFAESPTGQLWKAWLDQVEVTDTAGYTTGPAEVSCVDRLRSQSTNSGAWLPEICYEGMRVKLKKKKALSAAEKTKLAEAEFRLGHYQAALRQSKLLLGSEGVGGDWGAYWSAKSQVALADECFAKVAVLNPDSPRVHQMLAQQYSAGLDYGKAKAEYEMAIRLSPALPDLHLGLGTVYWRASDWPQAEQEFRKTLELAPGSVMAQWRLGNTYLQEGRWQEAVEQLQPIINDENVALSARLDLAKAESQLGQTERAIQELLPLLGRDEDGEVHFRLAALYRKTGDDAKAKDALEVFRNLRAASLQADKDELDALDKEQGVVVRDSDSKSP